MMALARNTSVPNDPNRTIVAVMTLLDGTAYEKKAPPKRGKSLGRSAPKQEPQQGT
jgi:hypothetical protein